MLVVQLHPAEQKDPAKDELGRNVIGYDSTMSPQVLYQAARGCWKLDSERAGREEQLLIVAEGYVRGAIEIKRLVPYGNRHAIEGRMLQAGDSVYDTFVGKPSPLPSNRNPVRYYNPIKKCACGCGGDTDKDFLPGHDQRAIHTRISSQFRSVADFIRWFDAEFAE